ncbi:MAG: hypothetical protein GY820_02190, partial [Gammaproteobacteria bacterium]|nr:hypothetical protein [Gammaproteobacteria bacterium]
YCHFLDTIAEEKRVCIGRLGSWACRLYFLGRPGERWADALKVGPRYFVPVALGQWILLSFFGYNCRGKTAFWIRLHRKNGILDTIAQYKRHFGYNCTVEPAQVSSVGIRLVDRAFWAGRDKGRRGARNRLPVIRPHRAGPAVGIRNLGGREVF